MTLNYPPGVSELPGDCVTESEYLFEIHGEITVMGTDEEDAESLLKEQAQQILWEAFLNGDIEII